MIESITLCADKIDQLLQEGMGSCKYQFEWFDLMTGTKHQRGLKQRFHWGSIYKLFVVACIIKLAEEGSLQLEGLLTLRRERFRNGNGVLKHLTDLKCLTYLDACKMVMATSDNICADELLEVVGLERFNALMAAAGCTDSRLSVNLDQMIGDLFMGIETQASAGSYLSQDFHLQFEHKLGELLAENYTCASDVNKCFHFLLTGYFNQVARAIFRDCLMVPNLHSRLSYYTFFSKFLLRGKTGTLASSLVNNECAAIISKADQRVRGYFSLFTAENDKRYFECNDVFGRIGLELVTLYEQFL